MLTARDFEAMADAITPALLVPYVPPARPFVLGAPDAYGVRPGYQARTAVIAGTVTGIDASPRDAVMRLGSALASALHATLDGGNGVCLSDGEIESTSDPATLHDRWREARVAVVATALRRFTIDGDDDGPPVDPARYREWTLPELQAWLDASGFEALFGGTLPGDDTTGVLVISAHTPAARVSRATYESPR